jgi:hypothetical protein
VISNNVSKYLGIESSIESIVQSKSTMYKLDVRDSPLTFHGSTPYGARVLFHGSFFGSSTSCTLYLMYICMYISYYNDR